MTLVRKIQDTARRISRLGRYVESDPHGPNVTKEKGTLFLSSGSGITFMVVCIPSESRVWIRSSPSGRYSKDTIEAPDLSHEEGLQWLLKYEGEILVKARSKAREEVINELVAKRIQRITKAKNRGFKADMKKRKRTKAD